MNKTNCITFLMVLCFSPFLGWSQQKVRALEFEVGGGYGIATSFKTCLNAGLFVMELRSNLPSSGFDIGMQLCVASTTGGESYDYYKYSQKVNEIATFMVPFVDFNFRRGRKVSYFVGSGMGMMQSNIGGSFTYSSLTVVPRIGMEFFNHLRLTLDYRWNPRGEYNYTGLSVGVVLGGGVKKER